MQLGYDLDKALTEISSKVSAARRKLPKDIYDPIISKSDPDAQPIIYLNFSSHTMTPEEVTDYLLRVVQPKLQAIDGVSEAQILGAREYAMRIWLNPERMAAHHVTATDIHQAISAHNIQSATGILKGPLQQFGVYSNTDLKTEAQFNYIPIFQDQQHHVVRIQDVGHAELGSASDDFSVISGGENTIVVAIIPKSNANPLDVSKGIKNILPDIQKHLPSGMSFKLLWDVTTSISSSLHEVIRTLAVSCIFVFFVIFFTLGSFRAVSIPIVTIPLSLIGGMAILYALNYSINTLTLLAFVLAIGLVVDDAIVVLENIHRHLAMGKKPFDAAIVGAREIAFAVIAMTLTLASVYAPIGFTSGLVGKLFSEFSFTLAGTVLVSGFLALTLSPMMCSKIYTADKKLDTGFAGFVNNIFDVLMEKYKNILTIALNKRFWVILAAVLIYISCYFLYVTTPAELSPQEDRGSVFSVITGPASANLQYTESQTQALEHIYETIPEKDTYCIINGYSGVNSAFAFLILKPWNERKKSAMEITQQLFPLLWALPGVKAFPFSINTLPGAAGHTPIAFVLKTTESYDTLYSFSKKLMKAIEQEKIGLINLDNELKIDQPQIFLDLNRDKAADLGITMDQIADSLSIFLGKPTVTRFNQEGRSYDVIPQLEETFRKNPAALNNLYVRTESEKLVPLSNLVTISERVIPEELNHFQQLRSDIISAQLMPGVTQGQAYSHIQKIASRILPKSIQTDTSGQLRQYVQAQGKMLQTFLFAIIFIYLVLAAQFESFRDPLIVMLSVPLSIAGALILLKICHGTMNIYTQIGLITLVGLITKNGILIVEFANQQQEKGLPLRESILLGASTRLRPILMTTCAMILGALPLVFASGAGAMSRKQMGLIIVGGMSLGTFFTLFVIPTAYFLFATRRNKAKESQATKIQPKISAKKHPPKDHFID